MIRTRSALPAGILTSVLLCAGPVTAENAFPRKGLEKLFASELDRHRIPSLAVAVVAGQRVLWVAGFGHEDRGALKAATPSTRYRTGSVGKVFNALAILSSGCATDACLDRPLPAFDPAWKFPGPGDNPVTLRALLSHSAGVLREPPVGFYLQASHPSFEETVASLRGICLLFEPGTNRIKYSNAGVALAGAVLQKLTGESYRDAVRKRVFRPAGMDRAALGVPPDTAYAVQRLDGKDETAPRFEIGMTPAGDMVASAADMAAFMRQLFLALDGEPGAAFDGAVVERMTRPFGDLKRRDWHMEVGLGFVLNGKFEGTRLARHGGGVYGFSTELAVLPEERLGVAVMSAREGSLGVAQNLAHHILRVLLAQRRGTPAPVFTPAPRLYEATELRLALLRETPKEEVPERWRALIGFYGWPHGGIEILSDGKSLLASVEGGEPDRLTERDDGFQFGKFDDYAYEFVRFLREARHGVIGLAVGAGRGVVLPRAGTAKGEPRGPVDMPCPAAP